MPETLRPLRVLQLIGDTDAVATQVAALSLHRELVVHGLEVRTLALAPGRRGGLEQDVPAIAPSRRSFAARGQVGHESRWADVVVVHAPRALTPATVPSGRVGTPPVVLAFWEEPPTGTAAAWSSESRLARAAARLVVSGERVASGVRARYGRDRGIVIAAADLGDEGRPALDGAVWAHTLAEVTE